MFYRLAEPLPAWTAILLDALAAGVVPELKADLKRLKTMAGRPERCVA
jgi:hypothetical protein